jgi:O-antigen/teichoic acid export membrane protein
MDLHWKAGQLMFGTLVAQLITFTTLPIITNKVLPSEFGKYTQGLFFIAMLLPFATLRIESLIVSIKDENQAKLLVKLGFISTILLSSVLLVTFLIYRTLIGQNISFRNNNFLIIIFVLVSQSFTLLLNQYNLRKKEYRKIMNGSILQNACTSSLQIIASKFNPIYELLLFSYASGRVIIILTQAKTFSKLFKIDLKLVEIIKLINLFKFRLIVLVSGTFIETAMFLGINIFIGLKYGEDAGGNLGLALLLFAIPGTLIGSSFGSVIFTEYKKGNKLTINIRHLMQSLIVIAILMVIILSFVFSKIANIFLSDNWSDTILLISMLGFPISINVLWLVCSNLMYKTEDYSQYLSFNILRLLVSVLFLWIFLTYGASWQELVLVFFYSGSLILLIPIVKIYYKLLTSDYDKI